MDNNERKHFSFFWPILLIAIGIYLFLNNVGAVQGFTTETLLRMWPLLLIIAGLDGYIQRNGFVGSTLAIGLGVLFLMANFGYLNVSPWNVILRLWPMFIIALGLDLIIGKKHSWSIVFGILVGILLAGGILYLAVSTPGVGGPSQAESVALTAGRCVRVEGEMSIGAGSINLDGDAPEGLLVSGEIHLRQGETLNQINTVTGGDAFYRLRTEGVSSYLPFTGGSGLPDWDLMINSSLPTDLSIQIGAGDAHLDLRGTTIETMNFEMGVGHIVVVLPGSGTLQAEISNAVGDLVIYVPAGTSVVFNLDTAVTGISLPVGYTRIQDRVTSSSFSSDSSAIQVDLSQAVGMVSIREIP